jgi:hypothetical protein
MHAMNGIIERAQARLAHTLACAPERLVRRVTAGRPIRIQPIRI